MHETFLCFWKAAIELLMEHEAEKIQYLKIGIGFAKMFSGVCKSVSSGK